MFPKFNDFHLKSKEVCYFILDLTNLNLSTETSEVLPLNPKTNTTVWV